MSIPLFNSQPFTFILGYLNNSYFDFSGFSVPTAITFPIVDILTKVIFAIVALAASVNEFLFFVKNKRLTDIFKHSNI